MKNYIVILCLFISMLAKANIGDTTIVQGHNKVQMTATTNFDNVMQLPDATKTYRKIIFEYTIGKYVCPGAPQYCGSWDYIVNFQLHPIAGLYSNDSFEIARVITPYATTTTYFPATWQHTYLADVTNYEPLLHDSANLKVLFGGYSYGFTISTRFIYIEGTPEKNIKSIQKIYKLASPTYGNSGAADIDSTYLVSKNISMPSNATHADLIFRITGHGSNPNDGCGEFCSKYFEVINNGSNIAHQDIWKTCGYDDIPAQTGTWPFDRANWCPGEKVNTFHYNLPNINVGGTYTVDVNMQPYAYASSQAHYNIEGQIIHYTKNNIDVDAELADIITPSTTNDYMNANPSCTGPVVKIRNAGKNVLSTATIEYGLANGPKLNYTWTGSLNFGVSQTVVLPPLPQSELWADSSVFVAKILSANQTPDVNVQNNIYYSVFRTTPKLPNQIVFKLRTNNTLASFGTINETSWQLFDANNQIVKQRIDCANSTTYFDTVIIGEGCYKLVVKDTGFADGINFWYYTNYSVNPLTGAFQIFDATNGMQVGANISKLNNKYYGGDFGAGFDYNFKIAYATGLENIYDKNILIDVFPNPATDYINIQIAGITTHKPYVITLLNVEGKIINTIQGTENKMYSFDANNLCNGFYTVQVNTGVGIVNKKVVVNK
jgi:Peptide-N-glycosidase F, C terminal/Secretion system C-terminal sorting domain